jgi:tetratricopeptide (TPR) repeat protein
MQWAPDTNWRLLRAAADLARRAATEFPDRPGNWITLGRLLLDLGDSQQCVDDLRKVASQFPACIELRFVLARALILTDAFEEALSEAESALAQAPDDRDAKILCFELLSRTKRWQAAGKLADEIAILSPGNWRLMAYYARSRDAETLLSFCDARLGEYPAHTGALYFKALTLAKLGRGVEAREVISLDRMIDISDLPVPAGYDNADAFCAALAQEIKRNPTLASDPRGLATRDGFQTRRLRHPGAVAIEALVAQIKQVVEGYESRVAGAPCLATGGPARVHFNCWAIVYGGEGHQKSHVHQDSWLSGVFFVAAPRPPGENTYRGSLMLGTLDRTDHEIDPPWGTLDVEPVPGRLVIFPSYLPHSTQSTGIEGARISVAFDIVPA